jgi:hypothetical protein
MKERVGIIYKLNDDQVIDREEYVDLRDEMIAAVDGKDSGMVMPILISLVAEMAMLNNLSLEEIVGASFQIMKSEYELHSELIKEFIEENKRGLM